MKKKVEIVLVEPEIPQNTGNIARTCVAAGLKLHLVEPLGFSLAEKQLRRAGLDYWQHLQLKVWPDLASLQKDLLDKRPGQVFYVTTKGERLNTQASFGSGSVLLFGKETKGLPDELRSQDPRNCLRIPMLPERRSLNLANAVALVAYEALRQQGFAGMC